MVTTEDKIREIKRELAQRSRVYPLLVEAGKMTRETADRQTEILRSILMDYEAKREIGDAMGRLL